MSRDRRRFADIIGDTARGRKLTVINAVNFTMAERLDWKAEDKHEQSEVEQLLRMEEERPLATTE
ncbi:hypothetical protein MFRU_007g02460 [Monilinia fructicola]|nr:hypothetical protein MFRU_007g02460 [Monilinia fructicola]